MKGEFVRVMKYLEVIVVQGRSMLSIEEHGTEAHLDNITTNLVYRLCVTCMNKLATTQEPAEFE